MSVGATETPWGLTDSAMGVMDISTGCMRRPMGEMLMP